MPSPKSAEASVIKFSTKSTGRAPRKRPADRPSHQDGDLITACVAFAAAIGGSKAAFRVDPTGNADFAQAMDDRALREARRSMYVAARLSSSTFDGLRAKAAIVGLSLETETDTPTAKLFMQSLADDIKRLCKIAP